jgi:hypothetical protein
LQGSTVFFIRLLDWAANLISLAFVAGGIAVLIGNQAGTGILKVAGLLAVAHVSLTCFVRFIIGEAFVGALGSYTAGTMNAVALGFLGFLAAFIPAVIVFYYAVHVIYCIALFRAMSSQRDATLPRA